MSTILFSHGFGVKADSNGMFTQIAEAFPEHQFIMFDYNTDLGGGDIKVASLNEQAKKLQQKIDEQADGLIIIAHSQGCVITGMVDLDTAKKVILLAPPVEMSPERLASKLLNRPGAVIDLDGTSKLPRTDGTTTFIGSDYIQSLTNVDPLSLYRKVANTVNTTIIRSLNDEVLGLTNVNTVANARHFDIEAGHNFTSEARRTLISLLKDELS